MNHVVRVCPKCKSSKYMYELRNYSNLYVYKCINCNTYFKEGEVRVMIQENIVRTVDDLNRVVLPRKVVELLGVKPSDRVVFNIDHNQIYISKFENKCGIRDGHYYDMNGNEIHEGDTVYDQITGNHIKVYLTTEGKLGIDATNPKWIESGHATPCEYGIYPLTVNDLEYMEVEIESTK